MSLSTAGTLKYKVRRTVALILIYEIKGLYYMTIIRAVTLRNIMIILCILMLLPLGQKALGIKNKLQDVQEAGKLYAAGELIAAENRYRLAAANHAISYKEEEINARLAELAPITSIRSSLSRLSLTLEDQLTVKDFSGMMESYASLLSLKSKYMTPGGPYEAYYRRLSADSGLSDKMTAGFRQFKDEYLAGLAADSSKGADSGTGSDSTDSLKWSLLQIPADYYGEPPPRIRCWLRASRPMIPRDSRLWPQPEASGLCWRAPSLWKKLIRIIVIPRPGLASRLRRALRSS